MRTLWHKQRPVIHLKYKRFAAPMVHTRNSKMSMERLIMKLRLDCSHSICRSTLKSMLLEEIFQQETLLNICQLQRTQTSRECGLTWETISLVWRESPTVLSPTIWSICGCTRKPKNFQSECSKFNTSTLVKGSTLIWLTKFVESLNYFISRSSLIFLTSLFSKQWQSYHNFICIYQWFYIKQSLILLCIQDQNWCR